ncbi:helix-turn-helix domain-containing protein [Actinocorallia longicatena]|uniref:PucR family transcriptional regulator n=1 Tax=Actinocorallia longicatena TaxID=111803 RepID=A0ABP6Q7U5_9ACTN
MAVLQIEAAGERLRYRVPADVATILRADLLTLTGEIVAEIRRRIPEFEEPCPGRDAHLATAVEHAVTRFVDQLTGVEVAGEPRAYRALGEWEQRAGRDLRALVAAYRLGARLVWRRLTEIGLQHGITSRAMWRLGEELFTHIDEAADQSGIGHADAASRTADDDLRPHRRRLLHLLAERTDHTHEGLRALADPAHWRIPANVACVTLEPGWPRAPGISPAVTSDVLMDLDRPDPCLIVPDPEGPGRPEMLELALKGAVGAVGPTVAAADAALSLRLSRRLLNLMRDGVVAPSGLVRCIDHLPVLLLHGDEESVAVLRARLYEPLADLTETQRRRLCETLLVWLTTGGGANEVGNRLGVHAQTVRYRLRRLEELFGERLQDPAWRVSMALTLFRDQHRSAGTAKAMR